MRDNGTDEGVVLTEPRSLIALDIVRGLAALAVFLDHIRGGSFVAFANLPAAQQTPIVAVLFALTRLGREAVLIFFVLSGFLVGGQLISRVRQRNFDVRRYAIDRMTRIFVPLVPICLFTAAMDSAVFHKPLSLVELVGNMTGLNGVLVVTLPNNAPLWSLAFEVWFYVLGGAAAYLVSGKGGWRKIAGLVALIVGAGVFNVLGPTMLLFWVLGALSATCLDARGKEVMGAAGLVSLISGIVLSQFAMATTASAAVMLTPAWAPGLRGLLSVAAAPVQRARQRGSRDFSQAGGGPGGMLLFVVPGPRPCRYALPIMAAEGSRAVTRIGRHVPAAVRRVLELYPGLLFLVRTKHNAFRRFLNSKALKLSQTARDQVISTE